MIENLTPTYLNFFFACQQPPSRPEGLESASLTNQTTSMENTFYGFQIKVVQRQKVISTVLRAKELCWFKCRFQIVAYTKQICCTSELNEQYGDKSSSWAFLPINSEGQDGPNEEIKNFVQRIRVTFQCLRESFVKGFDKHHSYRGFLNSNWMVGINRRAGELLQYWIDEGKGGGFGSKFLTFFCNS